MDDKKPTVTTFSPVADGSSHLALLVSRVEVRSSHDIDLVTIHFDGNLTAQATLPRDEGIAWVTGTLSSVYAYTIHEAEIGKGLL